MDLTSGPLVPKIITFTIPLILTGVLQLMFNAADLIVVGQFAPNGEEALAAVGGTGPLINLVINLFMGLSVGSSVYVAR
ncbi:MAG: MATE family efflux transporter, partial [Clostridia bacterium]|nr:MATE family efflux transporter [Clostridia bacterium]